MMGTVVPPLYRIVTKSWLSGQSISSVSSSNNNPLDTRLWGRTKKKDCGLLPGNQTENTHEFMQVFFSYQCKNILHIFEDKVQSCNNYNFKNRKNRKNPQIIQRKKIVFFQYFFFRKQCPLRFVQVSLIRMIYGNHF